MTWLEVIFQTWMAPVFIMAFVAMVGGVIYAATLPFLFVWAVTQRRGMEFLNDNPLLILMSVPVIAPLVIVVGFYAVYGFLWVVG